jgi:hypothetical protein
MTRFETVTAIAAAALIAAAYSPALAQRGEKANIVDGGIKHVAPEAKGGKGPGGHRNSQTTEPREPTFTVPGGWEKSKELARDSAIRAAVDKLHEYLMQQDPPVTHKPTTKFILDNKLMIEQLEKTDEEYVPSSDATSEKMYRMTIALKVDPEHVRELRSRDRSPEVLWILAGLGGLAAVVAGFFRVDSWTKGYLTSWLALGTIGAASLLAGLWWWAK